MAKRYWLFKSEPDDYSFSDLMSEPDQTAEWDGVRNYQARNFLRDEVKEGDGVLFYHSNASPPSVVGTTVVVRGGYPDDTAWDPGSDHPDPKSTPNPRLGCSTTLWTANRDVLAMQRVLVARNIAPE